LSSLSDERVSRLAELPMQEVGASAHGFVSTLRDIVAHREVLDLLIRRELKARYKDSRLGFVWSFIRPLTQLLVYYVVIGQVLGGSERTPQYAIFVFSGLTIWSLYNEIIVSGTGAILSNAGLIKKVYLPREIFPLATVGSALFNFMVQLGVLVAAVLLLGQLPLSWTFFYAPAAIIITVIYGLAFALLLSAANVFLRDIKYLVEVAMLLLFWASPIVYPWSLVVAHGKHFPILLQIYLLNPITDVVLAFQRGMWIAGSHSAVIGGRKIAATPWPAHMELRLAVIAVVGVALLWVAQRIFARLQGNFAQEI
jgi:ABC-2 type transport system permease protein